MAEIRRGKEKRFYFTRGQMVLLGGAFALTAVVIFFLGVLTGKGIEERRMVKTEEPPVKIPIKPGASGAGGPGQAGGAKNELTFYNTLTKAAGGQPSAEEKPKETKPAKTSVQAEVQDGRAPVKEAPPPTKPVKAEKSPSPPAAAETAEGKENGGGWTVQVNAFPDERSAKIWVDRLKNKGYNAYVTEVDVRGKTWYRVRVGNYRTREEAKKIEDALKNKENYSRAFTASR